MKDKKEQKIDILDVLIILAKHKKFILTTTLIVSIFAVTYSLLTTQYWTSRAVVLPVSGGSSGFNLAGLSSSLLGNIGQNLIGGAQDEGLKLVEIIKSRPFIEKIIQEFDLFEILEIENKDPLKRRDNAIKLVRNKILSTEYSVEKGLLYISVETKDKYLSAKIVTFILEELDLYNRNFRKTKAKETRSYISKRVKEVEESIDTGLNNITNFQKENNFIIEDEQVATVMGAYSELVAQKMESEIKLDYVLEFAKSDSKEAIKLKKRIEIYDKKINEMEISNGKNSLSKFITPLDELPDLATQYAKLKMGLEINKKVYEFLYPQLELYKIEEEKEATTIDIIEDPVPAGLRTWPRRALLCIALFMTSIISTSIISIAIEVSNQYLDKEKFAEFIRILKS